MSTTTLALNRHRQGPAVPDMPDMQRAQAAYRRSSSASSASSNASDCSWASPLSSPTPRPAPHDPGASSPPTPRPSSWRLPTSPKRHGSPGGIDAGSSCKASRTCQGMSIQDTRELWRCMLQLQRQYGCYNSTRIDLAVNAGGAGLDLMPNPFIIDTLNDSLVDLPAHGWDLLDRCLGNKRRAPTLKPPKSTRPWPRFWAHS
ncbi:hypothetical protein E4U42_000343 [Claviceps africana]|uniref:Uncharacterized protein n=1 Tax=Claviceps africana TaxID=83212 RepID=A0A8K0J057_9HYPO|nr:hypothetical protein E4U42_000343 [Claviceps africana]